MQNQSGHTVPLKLNVSCRRVPVQDGRTAVGTEARQGGGQGHGTGPHQVSQGGLTFKCS